MKQRLTVLQLILMTISLTLFSQGLFSEPPNLSLLNKVVIDYHDSGLYQQEIDSRIQQARQYILQQVAINQKNSHPRPLALILDIDETSLSNYDAMVKRNFSGDKVLIHKEILASNAPVIKPTLALYKVAISHGVKVFFVTGRRESERAATEKNLINAGYSHWADLYMRSEHYSKPSIIPFKSQMRARIAKQGYTIIASIGDQYSDIRGGYTLKGFKLPNPYYYLP
jgi:predicted secreted acid phosphatase